MDTIYNAEYYKNYRTGLGQSSYKENAQLREFLQNVAKRIKEDLNPKTVLDCGCALGVLVEELRNLGIEAYGIDVSEYAISQVDNNIKDYCAVQSLTDSQLPENFPKEFDVVTCIEVLEHLFEKDGKVAIANICKWGKTVVFSSTDSDFDDETHINVRNMDFWAKEFAENGLYNDLDNKPSHISPCARKFINKISIPNQVENYERYLRVATKRVNDCQQDNVDLLGQIDELKKEYSEQTELLNEEKATLSEELSAKSTMVKVLEKRLQNHEKSSEEIKKIYGEARSEISRLNAVERAYIDISSSRIWKMTKPVRVIGTVFKRIVFLFKKTVRTLRKEGVKATIKKIKGYKFTLNTETIIDYNTYIRLNTPTEKQLADEGGRSFKKKVKFSVLVPLYNTPENFLREMIDSVIAQSYTNWELCLADGSDSEHDFVGKIAMEYATKDSRVRYKKLEKNNGISGNTNACLDMATGNYMVLFDHDDLLHPSALYVNMIKIENEDADFLYSDEMTFQDTVDNCVLIHFKPDFSPETLCGHNYICHLTVFSRNLFEKVGYFSKDHDGSQDYDMVLRLTEQAKKIVHIDRVIYYWRSHSASVASDISAKPYCMDSARKAISDHLDRVGLKGEVVDAKVPTTYRVKYELNSYPLVSIIIPNKDMIYDLDKCINSIYEKTTYDNFEIVIVENNSTDEETFKYYKSLEQKHSNLKIVYWENTGFNFSAINNFAVENSNGEYVLLLNNDIEVISEDWIESMLMFAQREDVGAVGAKLFFPDGTVQHGGVILGLGGVAGHAFLGWEHDDPGYTHRLIIAQELTCVTAACVLVRRSVFDEIGGLDEKFKVAFNDIDMCMKIRNAGYNIIFTPYAELCHYESKSRGYEDTPEKIERFVGEVERFRKKWEDELEDGDPYYNANLTLDNPDFLVAAINRVKD